MYFRNPSAVHFPAAKKMVRFATAWHFGTYRQSPASRDFEMFQQDYVVAQLRQKRKSAQDT